jgi:hypothetical protein
LEERSVNFRVKKEEERRLQTQEGQELSVLQSVDGVGRQLIFKMSSEHITTPMSIHRDPTKHVDLCSYNFCP